MIAFVGQFVMMALVAAAHANAAACADMQLMQLLVQGPQGVGANTTSGVGCRTSVEGEACFKKVMWVKEKGLLEHPEWYHTLHRDSSLTDIQRHLHGVDDLCPRPCAAEGSKERARETPMPTPIPTPDGYVPPTPDPTAIHLGTPMPTEIHLDDLLAASYGGYEHAGVNCNCGNKIRSFSEEYPELWQCAEECNLYPHCMSFGLHPWQSIWRGHCDLYDAACDGSDGHADNTTCADPTPTDGFNVVFNRVPTMAPTPVPTASPDPCDVTDGSSPSSFYPCMCPDNQGDQCMTNEVCTVDTCAPPSYLKVTWPCTDPLSSIGDPYFAIDGFTATQSPVYKNLDGNYLFWDHSCDGYIRPLADQTPRWIIDQTDPNRTATMDLDNDGKCQYWGHHTTFDSAGPPLGSHQWSIFCGVVMQNMTVTVEMIQVLPTPAPTLAPGKPCACEMQCGTFVYMDLDQDGCLVEGEVNQIEELRGHFAAMDTNGDGCLNQTECAESPFSRDLPEFPIQGPAECDYGYYFMPGTSVCNECLTGETRRRRSEHCTPCPPDKEDLGEFDNCIGGVYLTGPIEPGDFIVFVNKAEDESGVLLTIGDGITMSTRNPGHYERLIVSGKVGFNDGARYSQGEVGFNESVQEHMLRTSGPFFVLDRGVHAGFNKFDAIVSACTGVSGYELSGTYPCGCGIAICNLGYKCDEQCGQNNTVVDGSQGLSYGTGGCCLGPPEIPLPTPVPTVSAQGDPHLVNLQGEHFDVNNEGEFSLLRIPQDKKKPPEVELMASITSEWGKPCTTYITEVELSGAWLGGKLVQVRSYLRSHTANEADKFFSIRVLKHKGDTKPWTNITNWPDADQVLFEQASQDGFRVTMSKSHWHSHKHARVGSPTVAGQFQFQVQNKKSDKPAILTIRQDLPGQEHLNMAVRHLSQLGRVDVGGLLGFDKHPDSLEAVTAECQRHRDGLDTKKGPHTKASWKTRWSKIKEQRHSHSDDNDAAASLNGRDTDTDTDRDKMCVCSSRQAMMEDELLDVVEHEGIMADFQTGRMGEATWD